MKVAILLKLMFMDKRCQLNAYRCLITRKSKLDNLHFLVWDKMQYFFNSDLNVISKIRVKNPLPNLFKFKPNCEIALACSEKLIENDTIKIL